MENKKEINLDKKVIKKILIIIFAPLLFTFTIEHFGVFNYQSYGGQISTLTLTSASFTTPFGNKVVTDGGGKGYVLHNDGTYKINGYYFDKLPFYIKGLVKDIIYPIILIVILLVFYFFRTKYSIKIS